MKLFVYGTLRMPRIQVKVFGRRLQGRHSVLHGYARFHFTSDGERYSRIYRTKGRYVRGQVLSITSADLRRADRYENEEYTRSLVTLPDGERAFVYVGRKHT